MRCYGSDVGEKLSEKRADGLVLVDRSPWSDSNPSRVTDFVLALSKPDYRAWSRTEKALESWGVRPFIRIREPTATDPPHILALTLAAWRTSREEPTLARADFLPGHLEWLERGPRHRFGLLHMMIETAYSQILRDPDGAEGLLTQIGQLLQDSRLAAMDETRWRVLCALSRGHEARRLLAVVGPDAARESLEQAIETWPSVGDPADRARLFEIEADFDFVAKRPLCLIEQKLEMALESLRNASSPRRAETRIRLGLARLREINSFDEAERDFRWVLDRLPEGHSETLRLEALHRLMIVAANRQDPAAIRSCLERAAGLYERYGHVDLRTDRSWIEAHLAVMERSNDEASRLFAETARLWVRENRLANARQTVLDWLEFALQARRFEDIAQILESFGWLFETSISAMIARRLGKLAAAVAEMRDPELDPWARELAGLSRNVGTGWEDPVSGDETIH